MQNDAWTYTPRSKGGRFTPLRAGAGGGGPADAENKPALNRAQKAANTRKAKEQAAIAAAVAKGEAPPLTAAQKAAATKAKLKQAAVAGKAATLTEQTLSESQAAKVAAAAAKVQEDFDHAAGLAHNATQHAEQLGEKHGVDAQLAIGAHEQAGELHSAAGKKAPHYQAKQFHDDYVAHHKHEVAKLQAKNAPDPDVLASAKRWEFTKLAESATSLAHKASEKARDRDFSVSAHQHALEAHQKAAEANLASAKAHVELGGGKNAAQGRASWAAHHKEQAEKHQREMEAFSRWDKLQVAEGDADQHLGRKFTPEQLAQHHQAVHEGVKRTPNYELYKQLKHDDDAQREATHDDARAARRGVDAFLDAHGIHRSGDGEQDALLWHNPAINGNAAGQWDFGQIFIASSAHKRGLEAFEALAKGAPLPLDTAVLKSVGLNASMRGANTYFHEAIHGSGPRVTRTNYHRNAAAIEEAVTETVSRHVTASFLGVKQADHPDALGMPSWDSKLGHYRYNHERSYDARIARLQDTIKEATGWEPERAAKAFLTAAHTYKRSSDTLDSSGDVVRKFAAHVPGLTAAKRAKLTTALFKWNDPDAKKVEPKTAKKKKAAAT